MNIFVLDLDPVKAAKAMDCVRVPKMVTESAQMMASALRRHGEEAVKAYRRYYHSKVNSPGGVHYRHTSPPDWWEVKA
jgi:hypothetical protein